jgi:hypothetical protein
MRPVDLLQIRPSVDLGRLAVEYEHRLPAPFRFVTTGLGTDETESSDWLSVLLFDPEYIDRLIDIGYHDARDRHDEIAAFLRGAAIGRGEHERGPATRRQASGKSIRPAEEPRGEPEATESDPAHD